MGIVAGRGAPSGRAPLAHLPQKPLGEVGVSDAAGHGDEHPAVRRRPPSPDPFPRKLHGGRGEYDPAPAVFGSRHLSPTQFVGERPGEGGALPAHHPVRRTMHPATNTPPPKLGEGSPAVARNEQKAGRGRGPPAKRAMGENPPVARTRLHRDRPAPTTPPPKLGPEVGEGSPAVARNEQKAGRGRGPPRSGPWGKTRPWLELGSIATGPPPPPLPRSWPEVGGGPARRREERAKGRAGERAPADAVGILPYTLARAVCGRGWRALASRVRAPPHLPAGPSTYKIQRSANLALPAARPRTRAAGGPARRVRTGGAPARLSRTPSRSPEPRSGSCTGSGTSAANLSPNLTRTGETACGRAGDRGPGSPTT
jgi:hypothetical protein